MKAFLAICAFSWFVVIIGEAAGLVVENVLVFLKVCGEKQARTVREWISVSWWVLAALVYLAPFAYCLVKLSW